MKTQIWENNKTLYVGFDEQYNSVFKNDIEVKDLLGGSLENIQISNNKEEIVDKSIILKVILDKNYEVIQMECLSDKVIEKTKISGIYAGALRYYQNEFPKLDEANVYLLIKQVKNKLNSLENNSIEQTEWKYAYDFCLANLTRFGVDYKFNLKTNSIKETENFEAWYQWWTEYFNDVLSDENLYEKFRECRMTCSSLSIFRPTGSFSNYLKRSKVKKISL